MVVVVVLVVEVISSSGRVVVVVVVSGFLVVVISSGICGCGSRLVASFKVIRILAQILLSISVRHSLACGRSSRQIRKTRRNQCEYFQRI